MPSLSFAVVSHCGGAPPTITTTFTHVPREARTAPPPTHGPPPRTPKGTTSKTKKEKWGAEVHTFEQLLGDLEEREVCAGSPRLTRSSLPL